MEKEKTHSGLIPEYNVLTTIILMIILFFTPLAGGAEKGVSVWVVHILVLILLLLWAGEWAGEMVGRKKMCLARTYPVRTYLDYPIFCFAILSILSALFSVSPQKSFWTLWNFFDYIALYYIVVNKVSIRNRGQVKLIIFTIITAGSLAALLGLLKYLGASASILGFTYYNPNPFGGYLAMVIPIALVMIVLTSDLGKRIIIGYGICLMLIAFILTLSRGGWFSFIFALLLMAFLYQQKTGVFHGKALVLILPVVAAIFLFSAILGYVNVKAEVIGLINKNRIESVSGRVPIWKGTLEIIRAYPLLGAGPGTFPLLCERYVNKSIGGDLRDKYAHSEYLQTMSEWGILSLGIILWIQTVFFVTIFKRYIQSHTWFSQLLRLGIGGSMVAISIHSLAEFTLHPMANAILCVVFGGMALGKKESSR